MDTIIKILEERGFIDAMTSDDLTILASDPKKPLKVYCGFDPTADSLHLGNLVGIMGLAWFQRYGHTPVVIVGGATGMIGDPSGKSSERNLLDEATLQVNLKGIKKNLECILGRDKELTPPLFLNNYDWFKNFSFIEFLRDVGKHFRISVMLAKEGVKGRLESEEGMSYTEFSYQLLQGYDFYHLYKNHGVTLQIGGSDQWGNITAGTDFVRKVTGHSVHGLTFPLLTRSDGQKFGKSEKGAIWLSAEKLSPYEFYQHLFRVTDADVIRLLKMLTFLELSEINELEKAMNEKSYVPNTAQRRLAEEVTLIVHGPEGLKKAQEVTEKALPGKTSRLDQETLQQLVAEIPTTKRAKTDTIQKKLIDIVAEAGFLESKSEARRLIRNGGLWLNNVRVADENYQISEQDLLEGKFLLFAFGKKHKALIQIQ